VKACWQTSSRAHAREANQQKRLTKNKCALDPGSKLTNKHWPFSLGRQTHSNELQTITYISIFYNAVLLSTALQLLENKKDGHDKKADEPTAK
jgi:hypothetical protein